MGFLFPLFLLAGLALLIPVLIHLFNLRRYKHVYFSNIRFLRALQLSSKRMGSIQKKVLLFSRLLFLAALVLAFAQPVLKPDGGTAQGDVLQVVYLDNSPSMGVKAGQQSLFDQAREKARYLVAAFPEQTRFVLLTNAAEGAAAVLSREEALRKIDEAALRGRSADLQSLLGKLHLMAADKGRINVYLFSDFQEGSFLQDAGLLKTWEELTFFCLPFAAGSAQYVYFDTVSLGVVQPGSQQPVSLIARLNAAGTDTDVSVDQQVRLYQNGHLKAGFELRGQGDSLYTDTLTFQPSGTTWERLELVINGDAIDFDDTFRMALKTRAAFEVLVCGGAGINPYLQTAFSGFPGFTVNAGVIPTAEAALLHPANLLVVQHLEQLTAAEADGLTAWLEHGRNVLIFPGIGRNKQALNTSFSPLVPIAFGQADSGLQEVVKLEPGHPLIYDMFDHIPDDVTLPRARLHFPLSAGFAAAEQVLMRFRDGTPFLAQYQVGNGKLFVCASPLGTDYSDFPLSYFFAPLLYKMAMPAGGGMVFSTEVGSGEPLWISSRHFEERAVWHARGGGAAFVPRQHLSGAGVNIYLGETAELPGFYQLHQEGNEDTFLVAVNVDRKESLLKPVSRPTLAGQLSPAAVHWVPAAEPELSKLASGQHRFPLWKAAVICALLALLLETWLLLYPRKPVQGERISV